MSTIHPTFDVIVVGGGHAGIEAAHAAARLGVTVALVAMDALQVGAMSCNPAIGGLAKGHLVREIDALGGMMGRAADSTGLQFRMLNASKGPAVRGPRAQVDRHAYAAWMQNQLDRTPGLTIVPGEVIELRFPSVGPKVLVKLAGGEVIRASSIVLTTGTFMDGVIHCGRETTPAGRYGEKPSVGLGDCLRSLGLETGRLKTGTPPRLKPETISWDRLAVQPGDEHPSPFSFATQEITQAQIPCHITYTNERTHEIVLRHLKESAVYSGNITGPGPRYCPSLEDKCSRFPDRTRHQIFLEPEEREARVIYPNGISTSLPASVQLDFLRTIVGLEQVEFYRPGYAIEYTFVLPHQLTPWMECRAQPGLFLAGQINGTTGYEEAAAQGLIAGLNAVRFVRGEGAVYFERHEAYLGVLMDDLVTKEHQEPYRMFTSRAEHRLILRQDNADLRLTRRGHNLGLVSDAQLHQFEAYVEALESVRECLSRHRFRPGNVPEDLAEVWNLHRLDSGLLAIDWLERPDADPTVLVDLGVALDQVTSWRNLHPAEQRRVLEQVDVEAKYGGYIRREQRWIDRRERQEFDPFPAWLRYDQIPGLRAEAALKLERHRPVHAAAAGRIAGVNPTDIALIQVHIHTHKRRAA